MTTDPTFERVRVVVERVAGPLRRPASVGPETPLSTGGFWLGSIDLLEVVVACEHEFGLVLEPEQELTAEVLRTLGSLSGAIRRKLSS